MFNLFWLCQKDEISFEKFKKHIQEFLKNKTFYCREFFKHKKMFLQLHVWCIEFSTSNSGGSTFATSVGSPFISSVRTPRRLTTGSGVKVTDDMGTKRPGTSWHISGACRNWVRSQVRTDTDPQLTRAPAWRNFRWRHLHGISKRTRWQAHDANNSPN